MSFPTHNKSRTMGALIMRSDSKSLHSGSLQAVKIKFTWKEHWCLIRYENGTVELIPSFILRIYIVPPQKTYTIGYMEALSAQPLRCKTDLSL